jgi:hypothetical protein
MTESDAMFPINLELINQLWLPNVYIYNLKTFKVQQALATQRLYLQPQNIQGTTTMAIQRLYLQPQNIQGTTNSGYPTSIYTISKHSRYNQLFLLNVYIYNLVQSTLATQHLHMSTTSRHSRYNHYGYPNLHIYNSRHSRYNQL